MKECYLYKTEGDYVQCLTCNHKCRVSPYKQGLCGVRENQKGKLYNLTYDRIVYESLDPIERIPLIKFLPNTRTLSIASVGCNFRCTWCQNWDASQCPKNTSRDEIMNKIGIESSPEQIVELALKHNCQSISYTYTEPTVFLELAFDTMKLAHENKLKNIWVSNGYISLEALNLISPYLDAINIDLKGFNNKNYLKYTGAKLQPVLDNISEVFKRKIHLEISTLVIPNINDSQKELESLTNFIASVSRDIPWHILKFFPAYQLTDTIATQNETLELAEDLGKKAGIRYINRSN